MQNDCALHYWKIRHIAYTPLRDFKQQHVTIEEKSSDYRLSVISPPFFFFALGIHFFL